MNKYYWYRIFKEWFKLPQNSHIVLYRNPNDCCHFHNGSNKPSEHDFYTAGDSEHYIYGYRNKKGRRNKGNNPIKIGKILHPFTLVLGSYLERFNFYLGLFSENLSVSICMYYIFLGLCVAFTLYNIPVLEGILLIKR